MSRVVKRLQDVLLPSYCALFYSVPAAIGSCIFNGRFKMKTLRPLVFCGPSGAGKSTLVNRMMSEFPTSFGFSVSHTTRAPRPGEQNGVSYYFVSRTTMSEMMEAGKFIETAEFSGNIYGTSYEAVQVVSETQRICVLDIEMEGVKQIKMTQLNPHYIFIAPPNLKSLEERLRNRQTETEKSLEMRLTRAKRELEFGNISNNFDIVIINDNVDQAYERLKHFVLTNILFMNDD